MANNANTQLMSSDLSTNRTSSPIQTRGKRCLRFHVMWAGAGAPAGTLSLEGSEDTRLLNDGMSVPLPDAPSWVALTIPTAAIHGTGLTVSGAAGATLIIVTDLPTWVRLKFTGSGGGATPNSLRVFVGHSE